MSKQKNSKKSPWYADGLRFTCLQCGDCCRGEPGFVWISPTEIEAVARHINIPLDEFKRKYIRKVGNRLSLVELPDGDCIFWAAEGCQIYPVRPQQCRTFPFWHDYVRSPFTWTEVERRCPAIGTGKLYTLEEIRECLRGERDV